MSFSWAAVDQREQRRQQTERELRDFLFKQTQDSKRRKAQEKQEEIDAYRRGYGPTGAPPSQSPTPDIRMDEDRLPPQGAPANTTFRTERSTFPSATKSLAPASGPGFASAQPSSLTAGSGPGAGLVPSLAAAAAAAGPNDEMLSSLRFAEESLQQERRSRGWLEAELQIGKTLMATMSAKLDKLQETVAMDGVTIRDVSKQAEAADRRSREAAQEMANRLERDQLKLHQVVADLVAKQRHWEQLMEDEEERHRSMNEAVNSVRYKLEAYSLQASEASAEIKNRTRDWEFDQQRAADLQRAVKEHDHAFELLQSSLDSSTDTLSKRLDSAMQEIRVRLDQDGRGRFAFENNMKDLYQDMKRLLQSQERELGDRLESTRQLVILTADRERQEREKGIMGMTDVIKMAERSFKESEMQLLAKVTGQISAIEKTVAEERAARAKFESQIRSDMQEGFRMMQQAISKKGDELQLQQQELKQASVMALRTIQESVLLVERSGEQKLAGVENVLRAEIQSRMDGNQQAELDFDLLRQTVAQLEKRLGEELESVRHEEHEQRERSEDELKKIVEQLTLAKVRSVEDLETQLGQLRKRLKESAELSHEQQVALDRKLDDAKVHYRTEINQLEGRIGTQTQQLKADNEAMLGLIQENELLVQRAKTEMDERLNARTAQFDQTMEMFKEDLATRATVRETQEGEARLQASIGSIQSSVEHLTAALAEAKENIETRATKRNLDDVHAKLKQSDGLIEARIVQTEEALLAAREDISARSTKKELEAVSEAVKAHATELQIRDIALEERINATQELLADKVSKTQMAETEKRLGEQFTQFEAQDIKLEQSISDTRESILLKANRMDLESAEKKLGRQLGQLDEKLAVVDQSVAEAKQELSKAMREDLAEMANRTNLALDVVGAKWEEFNVVIEDIKTRISETDSALRNRIKEQAQSTDVLIGEQTVSLEGLIASIKGQLAEQIDKLDGFPAQLQAQKQYFEDFKRSVLGELHEHAQQTQRSVSEVKDSSRFKASISDLDRLQATIQSEVQKLKTQMDVDLMTHDQKLQRLQDQDSSIKERLREFAAGRERDNQEFQTRSRQMHESATKRIDSLELHVAEYPKLIESLVSDIRLIRSDLDDRVQKELVRVEQQVALLKGRLQDCISEQAVQQTIQTYLSPVNSQLQRTGETIMDLRGTMDKKWDILSSVNAQTAQNSMRINTLVDRLSSQSSSGPSPIEPPGAVPFASSSVRSSTGSLVKGSFYKPAHLSFKDEPADRARGPSSDEADGGAESTGDDLTDLEKLADMATNGGFQLPAVPRRSPDGGEHEY